MSQQLFDEMLRECQRMELPCIPVLGGEHWLSAKYLCQCFFMLEKDSDFVRKCKEAVVPIRRVNQKAVLRVSDASRVFDDAE